MASVRVSILEEGFVVTVYTKCCGQRRVSVEHEDDLLRRLPGWLKEARTEEQAI